MKIPNVAEVLTEPSCEHNSSEEKVCERPGGGESCAFDGAYIVLNPITDAAHLIHGPIACCGNAYEGRGSRSTGSRLYRYGFTTDLSEMDIVYGAEEKLFRAIGYIAEKYAPSAIFVYATCVPAITGEDVESICKRAALKLGMPVIPVIAPGFLGHKNLGNRIAGDVLLEHVIGAGEAPGDAESLQSVNIIGEYNIAGEMQDIMPLFKKAGMHVMSKITGDSTFREITYAHRAKANLLVCGRALINVARGMEEKYSIPFAEASFYGMKNTGAALLSSAELLGNREIIENTRMLLKEEEKKAFEALKPYLKLLKGKKAVVYTGGVKSWSFISALSDLGIEVSACGAKKSSLSDIKKIKELIGGEKILKDVSPGNLLSAISSTGAHILIAGGRNQYLAYKERIPFLDVNQERCTPYAGYNGLINLAKDIVKTLNSPVWEIARKGEPWNASL